MFQIPHYKGQRFRRIERYARNLRFSLFLILITLLGGVVGLVVIENYTLPEAFYMTIITLSTVGFGEVQPLSPQGRMFVSGLIVFNIGTFTYAITSLSVFIIEGNLRILLKDFRVYNRIEALHQHIILCGVGRHGWEVMQELKKQHLPFVVIEKDETKIAELRDQQQVLYIEGDATHDEVLEEAGIDRAAALVVSLGEEADNVYIVLTARQLNPTIRIISRALDVRSQSKLKRAGADYVVMPEKLGGFYMATLVHKPEAVEFFTLLSNMGRVQIIFEEINVHQFKNQYRGKTIRELDIRGNTGANIIGVHDPNSGYAINPDPNLTIRDSMRLVVLGDRQQMASFKALMLR